MNCEGIENGVEKDQNVTLVILSIIAAANMPQQSKDVSFAVEKNRKRRDTICKMALATAA